MEDTKEFYTALLGIRHPWRVDKVELNLSKNRIDVWVKEIKGLHWKCPVCRPSGPCMTTNWKVVGVIWIPASAKPLSRPGPWGPTGAGPLGGAGSAIYPRL